MRLNLKNISFILEEPRTPGNIGSIARVCKNMGIASLILINPCEYKVEETYYMAHGSKEIIDSAKVINSLNQILTEFEILIGTTNRPRENSPPLFTPKEITEKIIPFSQKNRIGILFGSENNGLTTQSLKHCTYLSSIPMAKNYPAINLSQAAMIYAYELFIASNSQNIPFSLKPATISQYNKLYDKLTKTIEILPIKTRNGSNAFTDLFKRVFNRALMEQRDINLFLKLFDLIQKK